MTTLCLDFGNTLCKYAIFKDKDILQQGVFSDVPTIYSSLQQIKQKFSFEKSVLSSVIHHDEKIEKFLADESRFHKLGVQTKVNFSVISISKRIEIGADRLALCCAAVEENKNDKVYTLVISLGSCITYNFLNLRHEFLGGAISPGMNMRFKSMNDFTALLPRMPSSALNIQPPLVGYDTDTNLLSGVYFGMIDEIDGMIARYQDHYEHLKVYLTGGDMIYLQPHLKSKIFADQNLLLKGLFWIANENC